MKHIKINIILLILFFSKAFSQYLPDTILVKSATVSPGEVLQLSIQLKIHSNANGGFIAILDKIPNELMQTAFGELNSNQEPPSEPGTWWYKWTSFGSILKSFSIATLVRMDDSEDPLSKVLTVSVIGPNMDALESLKVLPSKSGEVLNLFFNVPLAMPEKSYELTADPIWNLMFKFPVDQGQFSLPPVVIADPIVIKRKPTYDERGDVNGDGKIDIFDLLELLRILAKQYPSLF